MVSTEPLVVAGPGTFVSELMELAGVKIGFRVLWNIRFGMERNCKAARNGSYRDDGSPSAVTVRGFSDCTNHQRFRSSKFEHGPGGSCARVPDRQSVPFERLCVPREEKAAKGRCDVVGYSLVALGVIGGF